MTNLIKTYEAIVLRIYKNKDSQLREEIKNDDTIHYGLSANNNLEASMSEAFQIVIQAKIPFQKYNTKAIKNRLSKVSPDLIHKVIRMEY